MRLVDISTLSILEDISFEISSYIHRYHAELTDDPHDWDYTENGERRIPDVQNFLKSITYKRIFRTWSGKIKDHKLKNIIRKIYIKKYILWVEEMY